MGIPVAPGDTLSCRTFGIGGQVVRFGAGFTKRGRKEPTHDKVDVTASSDRTAAFKFINIDFVGELHSMKVGLPMGETIPGGPGELFVDVGLNRAGTPIAFPLAGYIYHGHDPGFPGVQRGSLDGPGRQVSNEGASTLVNNTALTRTLTVPTNARWKFEGGYAFNADDVTRTITVRIENGSEILHPLSEGQSIGASTNTTFPSNVADKLHGRGVPMTLVDGDKITIAFAAGGSSAGGTARSAAVVEEWIQA